jgi:hypothetical protein
MQIGRACGQSGGSGACGCDEPDVEKFYTCADAGTGLKRNIQLVQPLKFVGTSLAFVKKNGGLSAGPNHPIAFFAIVSFCCL